MNLPLHRFVRRILAPGAGGEIERIASTARAGRRLDVGCGPESWLTRVGLHTVGVDVSLECARTCARLGVPVVVASAAALPFRDGAFDSVWSFGLLHHLDDREASTAIREMCRVTATQGETTVFDAVLPRHSWKRPLAWLIRRLDRGAWMRREHALRSLLPKFDCRRLTYASTGLEALLCRIEDSNAHRG